MVGKEPCGKASDVACDPQIACWQEASWSKQQSRLLDWHEQLQGTWCLSLGAPHPTRVMLSGSYITHVHSAREVYCDRETLPALPSSEPMEPSYGGLSFPSTVLVVILQGSHPNKIPRTACLSSVKLILYQPSQLHSSH